MLEPYLSPLFLRAAEQMSPHPACRNTGGCAADEPLSPRRRGLPGTCGENIAFHPSAPGCCRYAPDYPQDCPVRGLPASCPKPGPETLARSQARPRAAVSPQPQAGLVSSAYASVGTRMSSRMRAATFSASNSSTAIRRPLAPISAISCGCRINFSIAVARACGSRKGTR